MGVWRGAPSRVTPQTHSSGVRYQEMSDGYRHSSWCLARPWSCRNADSSSSAPTS